MHVPAASADLSAGGAAVTLTLDWDIRYKHMRAHTALHLLCALVRFPVTGGQIAGDGGRLDFDIPDAGAVDRAQLEAEINRLIAEDHPVSATAISDADLARRPELVRTMSVKPPMGSGEVRLVSIGEGGSIDLQPCGGTHVRSTGEIGPIAVGKLESKGRQNRRIRITFCLREEQLSEWLVSTDWLLEHLQAPDVAVLDASWHLPQAGRDARHEFLAARIPGAQFFDIEDLSDTTSLYPHMLPRAEKFSARMRSLGVGDGKKVIVYDALGIYSAARAWWMFRVFGKDDVAVLDGGLKKWKAEGKPLEDGQPATPQERHFTARYRSSLVRDRHDVLEALNAGSAQIADARSATRFAGAEPEPRAGVRPGISRAPGTCRILPWSGRTARCTLPITSRRSSARPASIPRSRS